MSGYYSGDEGFAEGALGGGVCVGGMELDAAVGDGVLPDTSSGDEASEDVGGGAAADRASFPRPWVCGVSSFGCMQLRF